MTADEQLAALPFHKRMEAAHRLARETPNPDERKALLATLLWPSWSPPLTPERQTQLRADVWGEAAID